HPSLGVWKNRAALRHQSATIRVRARANTVLEERCQLQLLGRGVPESLGKQASVTRCRFNEPRETAMVGPVLYLEMLLGGRRGRQYLFRWIYAGWLIAQFLFLYMIYRASAGFTSDRNATALFAEGFVQVFIVQQLLLLLLATPAFAAGAVTDEKTR